MIYIVKSNLRHNGTDYPKGSFLSVEEGATSFDSLVQDGVLELVEGAKTEAEAKEILAEKQGEVAPTEAAPVAKPQDTWGPQPDVEVVAAPQAAETAPSAPTEAAPTEAAPTTEAGQPAAPEASAAPSGDNL